MSGGFFRGTSAEQDTRFSNKQAKLLKSQKFAPELENLVDMWNGGHDKGEDGCNETMDC